MNKDNDYLRFTQMLEALPVHIKESLNIGVEYYGDSLLDKPLEIAVGDPIHAKHFIVIFDKATFEIQFRFDEDGWLVDVMGRGKRPQPEPQILEACDEL